MTALRRMVRKNILFHIIMSSSNEIFGRRQWYSRNRDREKEKSRIRYYHKKNGKDAPIPPKRAYKKKKKAGVIIERKTTTIIFE
tara:strand:+ start:361 stop:612 length:252 start_codon:yes stop_codon:yes gene_type:complete